MSGSPFKKISKKHCAISMMRFRNKKIYEQETKNPIRVYYRKSKHKKWAENDSLPILILYKTIPFI